MDVNVDETTNVRSTLEELLGHHGLKKGNLDRQCPQEVVTKIALELGFEKWQVLGRTGFGFPDSKIAAIGRSTKQGDERNKALLTFWMKTNGKNATYLMLAEALYAAELLEVLDKFCEASKQQSHVEMCPDSIADGSPAHPPSDGGEGK